MRVGVCGAGGRMGREVCAAVSREPDLELVCAVDPAWEGRDLRDLLPGLEGGIVVTGEVASMAASGVEVMVDFTVAAAARENLPRVLSRGISCVVGTTGFSEADLSSFDRLAREGEAGCLLAPNFAIGAVLMMEFARQASRFMQGCEVIELHHSGKRDSPSGTALATAAIIGEGMEQDEAAGGAARGLEVAGVRVHSLRLPGAVAHQEVIFGALGQTLTIRHDAYDRASFMPGVLLAVRRVGELRGLVRGLRELLELA